MVQGTTLPAPVHQVSPSPALASVTPGQGAERLSVEVEGERFRVRTFTFSTQWLPDTPSNRHLAVVWCRLLGDAHGKPLFTLQELALIVGSANRQAASQHVEDFRQCGEDFRAFVLRKALQFPGGRHLVREIVKGVRTEGD